jgi:hypothetical protein
MVGGYMVKKVIKSLIQNMSIAIIALTILILIIYSLIILKNPSVTLSALEDTLAINIKDYNSKEEGRISLNRNGIELKTI